MKPFVSKYSAAVRIFQRDAEDADWRGERTQRWAVLHEEIDAMLLRVMG